MAQSSCKRDTKSNCHPGLKVAPLRVFSCKHPLKVPILKAIFKTRNEESGNGNGERGIFKSGNL